MPGANLEQPRPSCPTPPGFSRPEGVAVFLAALVALGTALWALWGHWVALLLFGAGTGVFSVLYSQRLCRHCDKQCPFHMSGRFWKRPCP